MTNTKINAKGRVKAAAGGRGSATIKVTQPHQIVQPFGVNVTAPKIDQSQNLPTSPQTRILLV